MTTSDSSLKYNPFGELKNCIVSAPAPKQCSSQLQTKPAPIADPRLEERLFLEAVLDVKPMQKNKYAESNIRSRPPENANDNSAETAIVEQLTNLVKHGEGFVISDTPEYIEGTGYDVPTQFAERLHRGDFSIQAQVDLHGQSLAEARKTFEEFLKGAVKSGKRAVLIVHGRGLSSPGEPVLKNNIHKWLTCSHWRKWVIAFSSAQSYDGGTGATYILLRHRPISKRFRRPQRRE